MIQLNLPIVETKRLILRPVVLEDAADMYEYASDDEVLLYLSFPKHKSIEHSKEAITTFFLSRLDNGIPEAYALVDKSTKKMIGCCDIHSVDRYLTGEIGYVLNKNYWHQGLMAEACQKLIEIAFDYIGLERLQIRHALENYGSQRVIEKCDFRLEGLLRKSIVCNDKRYDTPIYSILKSEYLNQELSWQKER